MGYEGIDNAFSVEFDTFFNYENLDFYENHIAVMTMGWRFNISSNHSYALATSTKVPDLTDGIHTVRIVYNPNFNQIDALHPSFQVSAYTSWFFENADFPFGGSGDWGNGFGILYVYVDDLYSPAMSCPLNLGDTLRLEDGRMHVGFTASTGESHWQVHDILSWEFTSLYQDKLYQPPLIINDVGETHCANDSACVHPPNYNNFLRPNELNIFK